MNVVAALCTLLRVTALPLADMQREMCLHSTDRALCRSAACPHYAWCELCQKCLFVEHAVTGNKDEL